jgi:hypothetical protein
MDSVITDPVTKAPFDVESVRRDFPVLKGKAHGKP